MATEDLSLCDPRGVYTLVPYFASAESLECAETKTLFLSYNARNVRFQGPESQADRTGMYHLLPHTPIRAFAHPPPAVGYVERSV